MTYDRIRREHGVEIGIVGQFDPTIECRHCGDIIRIDSDIYAADDWTKYFCSEECTADYFSW